MVPRTTLNLDPSVLDALRNRASRDGKSMGQVASELLAEALVEEEREPRPFRWRSASLGKPLVDLEDKEAVYAILDQDLERHR